MKTPAISLGTTLEECVLNCSAANVKSMVKDLTTEYFGEGGGFQLSAMADAIAKGMTDVAQTLCPGNLISPMNETEQWCCAEGYLFGATQESYDTHYNKIVKRENGVCSIPLPKRMTEEFKQILDEHIQKKTSASYTKLVKNACKTLDKRLSDLTDKCDGLGDFAKQVVDKAKTIFVNATIAMEGIKQIISKKVNDTKQVFKNGCAVKIASKFMASWKPSAIPCRCSNYLLSIGQLNYTISDSLAVRSSSFDINQRCEDAPIYRLPSWRNKKSDPHALRPCSYRGGPLTLTITRNAKTKDDGEPIPVCHAQFTVQVKGCERNNLDSPTSQWEVACDCKSMVEREVTSEVFSPWNVTDAEHQKLIEQADCRKWFVSLDTIARSVFSITASVVINRMYAPCFDRKDYNAT